MKDYSQIITDSYSGYWSYLKKMILTPSWTNYFYWLIGISLLVWMLELSFPKRQNNKIIRRDFWLDFFYMFFNFFIFSLIGFYALGNVVVNLFNDGLSAIGIENIVAINIGKLPEWSQLLILFVIKDFLQWNIHRLLHHSNWLWKFHKVHHSVKEMGFAAHLRYHWMENIVYNTLQYLPLALIGFGIQEFFLVNIIATGIGHLNHANIPFSYGPLKYILNNPKMHLWHHAKELPEGRKAVNYGISLSIWDYLFGTAHVPESTPELGFEGDEKYQKGFFGQMIQSFKKQ